MDWFLNLNELRQNRLIRTLTKTQTISEEEFKRQRGTWLRARIGNVLNSMGSSFVRAQAHEELFNAYERYSQVTIEIFPNEVSRKWHKWLKAQPDFQAEKREQEILTSSFAKVLTLMVDGKLFGPFWGSTFPPTPL